MVQRNVKEKVMMVCERDWIGKGRGRKTMRKQCRSGCVKWEMLRMRVRATKQTNTLKKSLRGYTDEATGLGQKIVKKRRRVKNVFRGSTVNGNTLNKRVCTKRQ